jgi:hypothetical protein
MLVAPLTLIAATQRSRGRWSVLPPHWLASPQFLYVRWMDTFGVPDVLPHEQEKVWRHPALQRRRTRSLFCMGLTARPGREHPIMMAPVPALGP